MSLIINSIYAFFSSLGFGLLFNIKGKNLIFSSLCGCLGWFIYLFSSNFISKSENFNYFLASIFISLFSEVLTKILKSPLLVFLLCGIIPLVPGGSMFYTMLESLKGNTTKALTLGCNTLMLAGSIAIGIFLVSSFTKLFFSTKRFISKIITYKKMKTKV
ncbi:MULTISPECIES: threonine/serine exporter family protein [Bacillota]|nr:threonine/serine exporter family protein [Enterococcus faecium]MDC4248958.1 threonine/serine exporter family protein [Enterococcus faecium]